MNTQLKQLLVDAIRMMERTGMIDFNGHCSVRIPESEHFMINSGKSVRNSLTVHDIVTIDMNGNLVEGDDLPPMEFHIHSEVYRNRPEVNAVAHTHPKWSTLFTLADIPIQPVFPQGALLGQLPVFAKSYSINNKQLGEQVATTLGSNRAALLKAHGAVITGENIVETFVFSYYLEENAHRQYMASQLGHVHPLEQDEIELSVHNLNKPALFQKAWDNLHSKLLHQ